MNAWSDPVTSPRRLLRAAVAGWLVALACLSVPGTAQAITTDDDWSVSSTLDASADPEQAGGVVINVEDCREQVAKAGQEIVTFALENGTFGTEAELSVKVAVGNEACNSTELDASIDEDCLTVLERESSRSTVDVTLDSHEVFPVSDVEACEALESTTTVYLIVLDPPLVVPIGGDETDNIYTVKYEIRFATTRPEAPSAVTAVAGETTIQTTWTASAGEVDSYRVYATPSALAAGARPEAIEGAQTRLVDGDETSGEVRGAVVDVTYNVTVVAVDEFDNESLVGEVVQVTTQPVDDFWERFSDENPQVDGGHCFIATAAWGSYQAPHVRVLRRFRDTHLMTHAAGRWFVDAYYATSPPIADFIARHDALRAVVRALLLPLYGFALLMLYTGMLAKLALLLACALSLGLGVRVWRRRRAASAVRRSAVAAVRPRRPLRALVAALVAALALLVALPHEARAESPVDMLFEAKLGPYTPDGLGATYEEFFGDDTRVLFEVELDYQLYRGWGSLAIAGGLGYTNATGSAQTTTGEPAIDETTLNVMPLRLSAVYRWDWFWLRFDFPFTLYGKVGLDYWVWWITGGDDETSVNAAGEEGSGGTFGWHGAGGVAFVLDWLAPAMAANFDVEWGVNNSYLFAEFIYSQIDNFGAEGAFDLSNDGTFFIGLALEF